MDEIFLSYKVDNRKQVIQYYHELKEKKMNVWFDQLIPKQASWEVTIQRHLQNCTLVLCFISEAVLKDDWVLRQIQFARKYHKPIVFILLEEIAVSKFKKYKMNTVVHRLDEIPFEKYLVKLAPLKHYQATCKELRRGQTMGFLLMLLFISLTSYIFCYGIDWMNLHLSRQYGILTLGLLIYFLLTYLPYRWAFLLNSLFGVALLSLSIYVLPAYYISDISINPVFFLLFFMVGSYLRYFRWSGIIDFILDFLATIFLYASIVSIMIVFEYFLNYDISYFAIPLMMVYLAFVYKKRSSFFAAYRKYCFIRTEYHF